MTRRRIGLIGAIAASMALGCAAQPKQKPRIIRSTAPVGAGPSPALNSHRPIEVPSAPLGQPAVIAPTVPAIPVAPANVVPAQPVLTPAQPAVVPVYPSSPQPSVAAPGAAPTGGYPASLASPFQPPPQGAGSGSATGNPGGGASQ